MITVLPARPLVSRQTRRRRQLRHARMAVAAARAARAAAAPLAPAGVDTGAGTPLADRGPNREQSL